MIVNTLVAGKVPPNGKRWKECPDSNTLYVRQVVFGNGIFVALCDDELYYSENSMNWVKCSFPDENTIVEIAHIRDIWLAQSNSSSGYHLYYSEDGKTWTKSSQTFGDIISIKKAKYGGGIYVTNDGGGKIFYSEDGKTWESSYDSGTGFCRNTCYGNGKWVATWNHYVLTSTDGKAWERSYSNSSYYFNNINYANGDMLSDLTIMDCYTHMMR